ncbi:MAG: cell division protein ZapA [Chitinophagaceae bacterium]
MAELLPVNIVIADRTYRLRVTTTDEEVLRRTVKLINDKIVEYKTQLAGKDMQDYVSMALLWFATSQNKNSDMLLKESDSEQMLDSISKILDKTLEIS